MKIVLVMTQQDTNLPWDKALEFLVSTIGQSAVDSWRESSAVDSYLSNLRAALPKARLLIERSEYWRLPKYNPIDEFLSHLKDSVYEAEIIVDELEYQRLKNKVEKIFQHLNMNDCSSIKCFPEGFNNLVNLLLLSLPFEKISLVEHIENIFEAIHLYDLWVYIPHQKIENLKNICKLSGSLRIFNLEYVPSKKAAEEAQLNIKPLINRLDLAWSHNKGHTGDQSVNNEHHNEEVLHGLCPHRNLKVLRISNYGGRNLSPSLLKEEFLPNLTKVHFNHCKKASTISHLPRFITKLSSWACAQLENLQNWLAPNHLPALKDIKIINCRKLVSLPVESFEGFVSLEWLTIDNCRNLRSSNAMVLPPSVKGLELRECGDLEKSIPSCLQHLTSLETLSISDCQSLVNIPAEITRNLNSLSELRFEKCRKLLLIQFSFKKKGTYQSNTST